MTAYETENTLNAFLKTLDSEETELVTMIDRDYPDTDPEDIIDLLDSRRRSNPAVPYKQKTAAEKMASASFAQLLNEIEGNPCD